MKNKSNALASVAIFSIVSYIIVDYFNTKFDRIARHAAGESTYEKCHKKVAVLKK
jgi:ABC-type transport system involved in Fe-S cluster assembly fused permease/ATPase subunit